MSRISGGLSFLTARSAAIAVLVLTYTSVITANEHAETRSPEPKSDSDRELTFEQFAKDYRCPEWFRDAKFGLWAHWGPQTVPRLGGGWYARHMYMPEVPKGEEFGSQAYPFHVKTYGHPSEFGFKDVINLWKGEKFDADALTALFKKCGAKYVVALANHHDHFDCFASTHHPWNSVNMGPKRDIIGEWRKAATRHGLPLGVTVHDNRHWVWWTAAFDSDKSGPKKGVPYDGRLTKADGKGKWWEGYDPADLYGPPPEKRTPELQRKMEENWELRHLELVEKYQPDILYFDGYDFHGMPGAYGEHGKRVVERLYNNSLRRHGSLQAVCLIKSDRRPGWVQDFERGSSDKLEPKAWITDTTLGSDWFYKEDRPLVHNARTVIEILADAVSKNGGLLMNVELYPDGSVPAPQLAILEDIGAWLRTHGEAIYETRPWKVFGQVSRNGKPTPGSGHFNERTVDSPPYAPEEVRFTTRGRSLYAIVLNPRPGRLLIRPLGLDADTEPGRVRRVDMLGHRAEIPFEQSADGLAVTLPNKLPTSYAVALKIEGAIPE